MKKVDKSSSAGTAVESSTNVQDSFVSQPIAKLGVGGSFVCQGCKCDLDEIYSLRTKSFCYLCDPNITLEELLSDNEIN